MKTISKKEYLEYAINLTKDFNNRHGTPISSDLAGKPVDAACSQLDYILGLLEIEKDFSNEN